MNAGSSRSHYFISNFRHVGGDGYQIGGGSSLNEVMILTMLLRDPLGSALLHYRFWWVDTGILSKGNLWRTKQLIVEHSMNKVMRDMKKTDITILDGQRTHYARYDHTDDSTVRRQPNLQESKSKARTSG